MNILEDNQFLKAAAPINGATQIYPSIEAGFRGKGIQSRSIINMLREITNESIKAKRYRCTRPFF